MAGFRNALHVSPPQSKALVQPNIGPVVERDSTMKCSKIRSRISSLSSTPRPECGSGDAGIDMVQFSVV